MMVGFPSHVDAAKAKARAAIIARSETAKTAFRLLRRGIPSDELLTILHRLNEQRGRPVATRGNRRRRAVGRAAERASVPGAR